MSQATTDFINLACVLELDRNVVDKTIELRKIHKIKLPDAIIAASALVFDLTLITSNASDFKNIRKLKMLNPWELK